MIVNEEQRPSLGAYALAQLPNNYNGIYETLQLERQNPEARQVLDELKLSEWVAER